MSSFDLRKYKVVTLEDIDAALRAGAKELLVREGAILTPPAQDAVTAKNLKVKNDSGTCCGNTAPAAANSTEWDKILNSPEAEKIKLEIIAVGKKLWHRQYVDGNGGNISYRIAENAVLCTPTLSSKADLVPADICLVDLDGKQLAGGRARTSEILLHLEIYKAQPHVKACVHCHPPHATAYAITGQVPISCVIPEYEVFVGQVALSPYETPGTKKFAETVLPYVEGRNTILLANHGIISWADTVTHAEWYVEVVDTYCWTLILASQLGKPITHISPENNASLIRIKQTLGLADYRSGMQECQLCDLPEHPGQIGVVPRMSDSKADDKADDKEALIQAVTDAVMKSLNR